jgi:hypothetical protein
MRPAVADQLQPEKASFIVFYSSDDHGPLFASSKCLAPGTPALECAGLSLRHWPAITSMFNTMPAYRILHGV